MMTASNCNTTRCFENTAIFHSSIPFRISSRDAHYRNITLAPSYMSALHAKISRYYSSHDSLSSFDAFNLRLDAKIIRSLERKVITLTTIHFRALDFDNSIRYGCSLAYQYLPCHHLSISRHGISARTPILEN
jgi:hypothetical protein